MKIRPSFRNRRPWLGVVLFCSVGMMLFLFRGWTLTVLEPMLAFFSGAAQRLTSELSSQEEQTLRDQITALSIDRAAYLQLIDENSTLKAELGFQERTGLSSIPARVISKSLSQTVSRFVMDVGTKDGIQIGDPIVTDDGLFVGTVRSVQSGSSTAMALSDPSHTTAVSLLNDRRTIGVGSGTVGGLLEIRFIPADESIQVNDLVVTSGLEETVPSGLLIGLVNAVSQDPTTLFLTAVVEPLADLRRLKSVLVLTSEAL